MLTAQRCKCGLPMKENGTCPHCDQGMCTTQHTGLTFEGKKDIDGPACQPKHPDNCARCKDLNDWLPQPGDFTDLPNGYEDNTK